MRTKEILKGAIDLGRQVVRVSLVAHGTETEQTMALWVISPGLPTTYTSRSPLQVGPGKTPFFTIGCSNGPSAGGG